MTPEMTQDTKAALEVIAAFNDLKDFFDVDDNKSPDEDSIGWQGDGELPTTFGQIRRMKAAVAALKSPPEPSPEVVELEEETIDMIEYQPMGDMFAGWDNDMKQIFKAARLHLQRQRGGV